MSDDTNKLYDELEVRPAASPEVIRAAYKSLMQRFHPDRNPGDRAAAERAQRINNAHKTLSNPAARMRYDREQKNNAADDFARAQREQANVAAQQQTETDTTSPQRREEAKRADAGERYWEEALRENKRQQERTPSRRRSIRPSFMYFWVWIIIVIQVWLFEGTRQPGFGLLVWLLLPAIIGGIVWCVRRGRQLSEPKRFK